MTFRSILACVAHVEFWGPLPENGPRVTPRHEPSTGDVSVPCVEEERVCHLHTHSAPLPTLHLSPYSRGKQPTRRRTLCPRRPRRNRWSLLLRAVPVKRSWSLDDGLVVAVAGAAGCVLQVQCCLWVLGVSVTSQATLLSFLASLGFVLLCHEPCSAPRLATRRQVKDELPFC